MRKGCSQHLCGMKKSRTEMILPLQDVGRARVLRKIDRKICQEILYDKIRFHFTPLRMLASRHLLNLQERLTRRFRLQWPQSQERSRSWLKYTKMVVTQQVDVPLNVWLVKLVEPFPVSVLSISKCGLDYCRTS